MMKKSIAGSTLLIPAMAFAQPADIGIAPVTLHSEPYVFDTAEQHGIKVTVLSKDFDRPFAIEFMPDGDLLIVERGKGLRILRQATKPGAQLDPQPVADFPVPTDDWTFSVGVQDVALHPDFARNHLIYFTYNEPAPKPASDTSIYRYARLTLMRAKLEDGRISNVESLLTGGPSAALGSRLAFGKDGKLFVTTGGAFGEIAQELDNIYGKVLRLNDDGSIPSDNPFVGREGANPAIYSYGHRDQHGLMVDAATGAVLNAEHGPNGGDEVNLIRPGANYGWPRYSYGRQYDGTHLAEMPLAPGIEKPLLVWLPSIAPTGLMIYDGDRFPKWKGNLFVGSGRRGEIPGTGGLERVVFSPDFGELRRETLLTDLHQRVRDFAQGPDGLIYVVTDGPENAVLRIEPSQ
jgi:glucose/arabinose dehydrogenase